MVTQDDQRRFIVERLGADELNPANGIGIKKLTEEFAELEDAVERWRFGQGDVSEIAAEAGDMLLCLYAMGCILGFDLMAAARAKWERNMNTENWYQLPDGRWKRK